MEIQREFRPFCDIKDITDWSDNGSDLLLIIAIIAAVVIALIMILVVVVWIVRRGRRVANETSTLGAISSSNINPESSSIHTLASDSALDREGMGVQKRGLRSPVERIRSKLFTDQTKRS